MSQLYARVFVGILDSSIAEDFTLRHVFEDMLKLADYRTGIVDMTRQAMARRLNIPLDVLNAKIAVLESQDPASRDGDHEGRRLVRLDDHRDWGWRIVNWHKYAAIRDRADTAIRVARYRSRAAKAQQQPDNNSGEPTATQPPQTRELPQPEIPSWETVKLRAAAIGLAEWKARDWFDEMEGCGWVDYRGRKVVSWDAVLRRVRTKWEADGRPMTPPTNNNNNNKQHHANNNNATGRAGHEPRANRNRGTLNDRPEVYAQYAEYERRQAELQRAAAAAEAANEADNAK